jgi:hypothetical protein
MTMATTMTKSWKTLRANVTRAATVEVAALALMPLEETSGKRARAREKVALTVLERR